VNPIYLSEYYQNASTSYTSGIAGNDIYNYLFSRFFDFVFLCSLLSSADNGVNFYAFDLLGQILCMYRQISASA